MAGGGIPCIEYLIQDQNFYLIFYWKPMKQLKTGTYKILCQYCTGLFFSKIQSISMKMRAIIVQVRAQAKVSNFSHKSAQ